MQFTWGRGRILMFRARPLLGLPRSYRSSRSFYRANVSIRCVLVPADKFMQRHYNECLIHTDFDISSLCKMYCLNTSCSRKKVFFVVRLYTDSGDPDWACRFIGEGEFFA